MKIIYSILYFISICSYLGSCKEQKHENKLTASLMKNTTDTANQFNIPEVDSLFEILEKKKYLPKIDGKIKFFEKTDEYTLSVSEHDEIIQSNLYTSDSYFFTTKLYYKSGMIESKGVFFNNGPFHKGKWYYFDQNGNHIKTKDYDAPYDFSFEDLHELLKQKGISLTKGAAKTRYHTSIMKLNSKNGNPLWSVKWFKSKTLIGSMKVDGKTGEVVEMEDIESE